MIDVSNTSPYIVAYGTSMKEISNFYIEVEKHLICVSVFQIEKNKLKRLKCTRFIFLFSSRCPKTLVFWKLSTFSSKFIKFSNKIMTQIWRECFRSYKIIYTSSLKGIWMLPHEWWIYSVNCRCKCFSNECEVLNLLWRNNTMCNKIKLWNRTNWWK